MAINPLTQYPGKIAAASGDYPYGQAQNITTPSDGTGTPWEAALVNDLFGLQQALLKSAAIVPSGTPEKVGASEYLQAIVELASGRAYHYDESGVANAYVLDVRTDQQGPSNLYDGLRIKFKPGFNNTGASTVNPDGLGVISLRDQNGSVLDANMVVAGEWVTADLNIITGFFEIQSAVAAIVKQLGIWQFKNGLKGLSGKWLLSTDGTDITPNRDFVLYNNVSNGISLQFCDLVTGAGSSDGFQIQINSSQQVRIHNYENTDMLFSVNNLQEMFLDAINRGLVLGAGTGNGEGTVTTTNGAFENTIRQTTFSGRINSSGVAAVLPPGWTSIRLSTGDFQITHNLGLASINDLNISANVYGATAFFATIFAITTNTFRIATSDTSGTLTNLNSMFVAHLAK